MKIKGYPSMCIMPLQKVPAGSLFEHERELWMQTDGAYGEHACMVVRVRDGHVGPVHKTINVRMIEGTLVVAEGEVA